MNKSLVSVIFFFAAAGVCFSQKAAIDYNTYYQFPFSVGVEYEMLSPFADYGASYNIFGLAVNLRRPFPSRPAVQPLLRFGMMKFDNQDLDQPLKWDHTYWYGQLGSDYAYRFSKNFEISGGLTAGLAEAVFPDLLPDEGTVGMLNFILDAGVRLHLNPSYNVSIDIHPNLRYLHALGDLDNFDGFSMGIGFSASYRFGSDPDAPGTIIRSLKFSRTDIPDLFAAMQSYYVNHSFGSVTITNTGKDDVEDLDVSFFQAGFMDSPTPAVSVPVLESGKSIEVPLVASFNREVFTIEGITPLTGEILASYTYKGKPAKQKISVTYNLYDKTSIIWNDNRKVAAYITPADSALRNYVSFIRQSCKKSTVDAYPETMQEGIQIFDALGVIGCLYQADPVHPFTESQGDKMIVDSVSLPRYTLKNLTGDCDDLTVLYCSLLETVGIETGFITVPGHIYAVFNTKVPVKDYAEIYPDRNMCLSVDGELWVPVEITMIGRTGFLTAWKTGMDEWTKYADDVKVRSFYKTRDSQKLYRSVGLTEKDMGLQYGSGKAIDKQFKTEMDQIVSLLLRNDKKEASEKKNARSYNRLGIEYARYGLYGEAEKAFKTAILKDPNGLGPRINLGNLDYLQGRYTAAKSGFEKIYEKLKAEGRDTDSSAFIVLINLARSSYMLKDYDLAKKYLSKAKAIDSEKTKKYEYLSSDSGGSGRGAETGALGESSILFAGDKGGF